MDFGKDWDERTSDFFTEYVRAHDKDAYTPIGSLTFTAMREAVDKLISERVFSSVFDMRQQAMKDFGIILPEELFI